MRTAMALAFALAASPALARCDDLCRMNRQSTSREIEAFSRELWAPKVDRQISELTDEVRRLRSDVETQRLTDDYYSALRGSRPRR